MATYKTYLFVILLSIIVIGGVIVAACYQRDLSAARERINSLGSQVIETDCGPIEYARAGDGYPALVVTAIHHSACARTHRSQAQSPLLVWVYLSYRRTRDFDLEPLPGGRRPRDSNAHLPQMW